MTRLATRPEAASARIRRRIVLGGRVQGVGMRPFLYCNATASGLSGWVRNAPQGVVVEVEGGRDSVSDFIERLRASPPPGARIDWIDAEATPIVGEDGFHVLTSDAGGLPETEISPDLATCGDCLRELFDPKDRRYRYPFIACAHCGPRYSILESLPYDRARTSMRRFAMCEACRTEYENPADRRFHAEPIACPACGPRLDLLNARGDRLARDDAALAQTAAALRAGGIVAVKGVGGFHLFADARNDGALRRLRLGKRRAEKPFAVMYPTLDDLRADCRVSREEAELLESAASPIVLLRRSAPRLSALVAPGLPWLGAFLPYAPLHHLLLRDLGFPVVATSGNPGGEPIVAEEGEALERLSDVADLFLTHDRPIVRPIDDSVLRVVAGRALVLRRARGYAPAPIRVDGVSSGVVAVGGHLKTTIAVTRADVVILSPHIGDLDGAGARAAHRRAIQDMLALHGVSPRLAACDLHPDYASSACAESLDVPVAPVQHHLAHVAACMAENGLAPPLLGVAFDGAGFGAGGGLWGGEFLLVEKGRWRRVAHLRPFRLPGADAAMREPRRAAFGLLYEVFGERAASLTGLAPVASFSESERAVMTAMVKSDLNAPLTTSAGRLFDAFAALAGLRQRASYEGQAAAEFEGAAEGVNMPPYPFILADGAGGALVVDWRPALDAALRDIRAGHGAGVVSAAFHLGLARAIAMVAERLNERRIALSGGCFQNARLTEAAIDALRAAGIEPFWHRLAPPNDGGLAFGQAVWTAWSEKGGTQCV